MNLWIHPAVTYPTSRFDRGKVRPGASIGLGRHWGRLIVDSTGCKKLGDVSHPSPERTIRAAGLLPSRELGHDDSARYNSRRRSTPDNKWTRLSRKLETRGGPPLPSWTASGSSGRSDRVRFPHAAVLRGSRCLAAAAGRTTTSRPRAAPSAEVALVAPSTNRVYVVRAESLLRSRSFASSSSCLRSKSSVCDRSATTTHRSRVPSPSPPAIRGPCPISVTSTDRSSARRLQGSATTLCAGCGTTAIHHHHSGLYGSAVWIPHRSLRCRHRLLVETPAYSSKRARFNAGARPPGRRHHTGAQLPTAADQCSAYPAT